VIGVDQNRVVCGDCVEIPGDALLVGQFGMVPRWADFADRRIVTIDTGAVFFDQFDQRQRRAFTDSSMFFLYATPDIRTRAPLNALAWARSIAEPRT
jgi:hypothetical protein